MPRPRSLTADEPYVPDEEGEEILAITNVPCGPALAQTAEGRAALVPEVVGQSKTFTDYVAKLEELSRKADRGEALTDSDLEYIQTRGLLELLTNPKLRASHKLKAFDQILQIRHKKLAGPREVTAEAPEKPTGISFPK